MSSWRQAAGWRPCAASDLDQTLPAARVMGVFGLRGQVKIMLYHPGSSLWPGRRELLLAQGGQAWGVEVDVRLGPGGRWLGSVSGCTTPEQARELLDAELLLRRSQLPALPDDEFYLTDVLGAPVWMGGEPCGRLVDVHQAGPVDLLEVHDPAGGVHFVPCRKEFVVEVRRDRVLLQPGALDSAEDPG